MKIFPDIVENNIKPRADEISINRKTVENSEVFDNRHIILDPGRKKNLM